MACVLLAAAPTSSLPAAEADVHAGSPLRDLAAARPAEWLPVPVIQAAGPVLLHAAEPALRSSSSAMRGRAAFLLGDGGQRRYERALRRLLKDHDVQVRLQAGVALCRLRDRRGMDAAAAALSSGRSWLRYYAVVGLWAVGGTRAMDILRRAEKGQNPLVATAIRKALAQAPPRTVRTVPARHITAPTADVSTAIGLAADAFITEGDWWWHKGEYDQVVRANQVATFLEPSAVEQYTNSAWLLWSMGRHAEAIDEYHRCIQANPRNPHGYFYLGEYYLQHRQPAAAETYLRRAASLAPHDAVARRALAHCLEKQGKLAEALDQWNTILRDNPTDGAAIMNRDRVQSALKTKSP
jgi:tetratricopeptide (TPR) repeat protein